MLAIADIPFIIWALGIYLIGVASDEVGATLPLALFLLIFLTFCSTYYLTSPPKQNRREMASLCFIHPPKLDLHRLGHPSCCFYQYE